MLVEDYIEITDSMMPVKHVVALELSKKSTKKLKAKEERLESIKIPDIYDPLYMS